MAERYVICPHWRREGDKIIVQNMVGPYPGQLHEHTEEEFREWSKDIPEDRLIEEGSGR
jgi:hypothetical protein